MNVSSKPLALITGGAVRLGEATTRRLASMGYTPVIHAYGHFEKAEALAQELNGIAVPGNLMERAAIDSVFEAIDGHGGRLEVLVNNAAIFQHAPTENVSQDMWDRHLALNLTAPYYCAQLAAPRMRTHGRGVIINMLDIDDQGFSLFGNRLA